jgi:uncharacterized membrane protein YvlD (DUF360 family)
MNINIKEKFLNKASGFYVGLASCVLALITMFIYIGMDSAYFNGWVITGFVLGIVLFFVAELFDITLLQIAGYIMYMVGLYHFLVLEITLRLDAVIVYGIGGLEAIFIVALIFFLATIITAIVSSCMKQNKS